MYVLVFQHFYIIKVKELEIDAAASFPDKMFELSAMNFNL